MIIYLELEKNLGSFFWAPIVVKCYQNRPGYVPDYYEDWKLVPGQRYNHGFCLYHLCQGLNLVARNIMKKFATLKFYNKGQIIPQYGNLQGDLSYLCDENSKVLFPKK